MTEEQILDEHPDLEQDDFRAVYQFAAQVRAGPISFEPPCGPESVTSACGSLGLVVPGLVHVRNVGLMQATDDEIRGWAQAKDYIVVTADYDSAMLEPWRSIYN